MGLDEAYFSTVRSEYDVIVETAWGLLAQPLSLYLRGSALDQADLMHYRPWDIDLMLFARNPDPVRLGEIRTHVSEFNQRVKGMIPPLDLTVTDHRSGPMLTARDRHIWLLLKGCSVLLKGVEQEWLRVPGLSREERLQILVHSQTILDGRLTGLLHGPSRIAADTDSRCRHVVKHLIRQGNVIRYVRDNTFTRSVAMGASALEDIIGREKAGLLANLLDYADFGPVHIAFLNDIYREIKGKSHVL
jgi:hypothetical protein